ncbi:EAL domain-containing protein (plasmid) [Rhizobium sp. CB3060]|uniref:sensor domain-containing protein n=1 Tax=Rhizobium sp. CB3060 TaxID=3138255 RepID=UPI0021A38499|nr:EAL domain-containing protein [Rhizobium tropici]UWU24272.1 EAL domain-containing protein [Rhizobium tropici]
MSGKHANTAYPVQKRFDVLSSEPCAEAQNADMLVRANAVDSNKTRQMSYLSIANLASWSFDVGTGGLWWSSELDRLLNQFPEKVDRHQMREAVGGALAPWLQAIALRSASSDGDQWQDLKLKVDAPNSPGKIIQFQCHAGARHHRSMILTGIAYEYEHEPDSIDQRDRLFREAFEYGPFGAALIDSHGRYLKVNEAFAGLLGYTREELSGRYAREVTPAGDISINREAMQALLQAGNGRTTISKQYFHRDGHLIDTRVEMATISGDITRPDETLRFLAFVQDLTELRKTQAELYTSQIRSELALESAEIGIWEWNGEDNTGFYSPRTCEILDVDLKELSSEESWFARIHPEDLQKYVDTRTQHLNGNTPQQKAEIRIRQRNGSYKWVEDLGKVVDRDEHGRPLRVVGTLLDIHDRKVMEETLAQQSREIASLAEHSPDGMIRYDCEFRRLHANPAMRRFLGGIDPKEVIGLPAAEGDITGIPADYLETLRSVLRTGQEAELETSYKSTSGSNNWLHARFTPEINTDGKVSTVLVLMRDITEAVSHREDIQKLAYFDALTGLPNRARFNRVFETILADAEAKKEQFALIILDLDNFKDVNDTLGHAAGDQLLCEVARRLSAELRHSDNFARLGGDEFAIFLQDVRRRQDVTEITNRLLTAIARPFHFDGRDMLVSGSLGIACYPDDGASPRDLFAHADAALYEAKARGRNNFQYYDEAFTVQARLRVKLGNALHTACANNELELYYQPKVNLSSGEIIGAEALLRWWHPEFGLLMPNSFITIAEENGTIIEIGDWVIRAAAQTAIDWNSKRSKPLKIAINFSPRQFKQNDLAKQIELALTQTGCRAEWLECEITESLLLDDEASVQATLEKLRTMGLSIAIDDFGTGHSALAYLSRFPIDVLKIDRSFVAQMAKDHRSRELIKAFTSIADALGMTTVAEGIETSGQADSLNEFGCEIGQGYLFGKPVPLQDFAKYFEHRSPV